MQLALLKKMSFALILLLSFFGLQVQAQTDIVTWTFEGDVITPAMGVGTASAGSGLGSQIFPAGNGSVDSWSFNNWSLAALDLNDYIQFSTSTTGFAAIQFLFEERRSDTGIRDFEVRYSTDGMTFIAIPATLTNVPDVDTWRSQSFDFSAITSLNNKATVYFRIYGYNAEGTTGRWRFDNVKIQGTTLPTTLFFSEYVEGSGDDKALEIYNPSASTVNLATGIYTIEIYANGSFTATSVISLTGAVSSKGTYVIRNTSSTNLTPFSNQTGNLGFNGDDAIVLKENGTIIDVIGQVGNDPGTEWGTGLVSTLDNTIRRKCSVITGSTNSTAVFDPSIQWDGFANNTFDGLGAHCPTAIINVAGTPLTAFSTIALGTPSAEQTYTLTASSLTTDLVITAPSNFEIAVFAGGTFTSTFGTSPATVPFALANATTTTVKVRYNPSTGASPTGDITHVSAGATTQNVAVTGYVPLPITPIYTLQGAATATSFIAPNNVVATSGVVTADFQTDTQMRGFFIQDITGDGNALTSDGIFVYVLPSDAAWRDVNVGDVVRVQGEITESFAFTQINNVTSISILGVNALPTPVSITFPQMVGDDLERYEGMYTSITNTMTVTQNFVWGRFGELSLFAAGRSIQPTQQFLPGSPEYTAEVDRLKRNSIVLDDGSTLLQNPNPLAYVGLDNTVRAGDQVTGLTGVVNYSFGNYKFNPTVTVAPTFNRATNPRTAAPASVGAANLKVASFNVLNYFLTYPSVNPNARGANNDLELQRQEDKIVPAILGLDADVIGLMEISNIDGALAKLVTLLNAATAPNTWASITFGVPQTGTDAIKVALIYKPAVVTPSGVVMPSANAIFDRPPLAQTFTLNSNAEKFSVVVNHFKSKGGTGAGADADSGDGAGNFNSRRTLQAAALRTLVTSLQTSTGDDDVLVIGDLNAYAMETPITEFTNNGFVNLIDRYVGNANGYSYIFNSYSGYLDHALATSSLAAQTTGTTEWHINADEPVLIDYNTESKAVAPATTGSPDYWAANPYRSSDHDPVIVGLNLQPLAITALSPADNTTNVAINTNLVLTFNRNVQAGTGNITVTDGTTPITFPIAGNLAATVTIATNTVTINLAANLVNSKSYNVLIGAGAIQSTTGNNFAGLALATDWNFTTVAAVPTGGGGGNGGTTPTVNTPTNFKVVTISTSQINLSWDAVSGATGYTLYRGNTLIATLGTVTSYEDRELVADTFYAYRLVATNSTGQSNSISLNIRTLPAAPFLLSVTNACSGSSGIIRLASLGAVVYRIYANSTSTTPLFETDNATITSPSITETTTYYISILSNRNESTRTAFTVNVNPLPAATIIESRIISCTATATITAQAVTGASYTWLVNGNSVATTTTATYQATRSGNYQVQVTLNGCSVTSSVTPVSLSFAPLAEITQGTLVRSCASSTTISAKDAGTGATYTWTRGNVVVGNTASVSVSQSGTYTLTVTQNGCSATSNSAVEISTISPNISFSASKTTFCPEEEVTLRVNSPQQNVTYTWVFEGRVLSNVIGTEYKTSIGGVYRVEASQNSCTVLSTPVTITRTNIEPVYLREEGNILRVESSTPITNVVWFFNGREDATRTGQTSFIPNVTGLYSAQVTFNTGCKGFTMRTVYYTVPDPIVTGDEDIIDVETIVYPNPSTTGIFRVQLSTSITSDVTFTITDNIGRTLENKTIKANEVSTLQTLDLSKYAKGMYVLTINTEEGTIIKKIIIE